MKMLSPRQIHLDFHTSEKIPDIAKDFNAEEFASVAKNAHISSMTVFARCHHGWLYYPSEKFPELIHPNLKNKNLLLEQVRALHKVGINAPVYITVQWDYHSATNHPEWLIRKKDGAHEGGAFTDAGFYQSLCVNTGYRDFLFEHTAEVCRMLSGELDGLFFDIVGIRPCLCSVCRKKMAEEGYNPCDDKDVRLFAKKSVDKFKADMTALVRKYSPDCTIFYNAGHIGPCTKESKDSYTHFELESLPSGSWGYLHFPMTARYARNFGVDCMGMTGKFHTEWADFHSLKNQAALEFECFRMLSLGFATSVGDQLEPFGRLNCATYKLIGNVFSQLEEREEWARPSVALREMALITSEGAEKEHSLPNTLMGAVQMFEELALQYDIIDRDMDFSPYKLIVVPEDVAGDANLSEKIDSYVKCGGKVLALGKGGLDADMNCPSSYGVKYVSQTEKYPDFIVANGELAVGLEENNEYVIYMRGETVLSCGAKEALFARAPFFTRAYDHFCSHRYTPSAKGEEYAVGFENENVIFLSHPIFTQYRKNAPFWCKKIIDNAVEKLLGKKMVYHNGPSTMTVSVLDQPEKNRTNLHILTYVHVRKSADMDIIEDRTVVRNIKLSVNIDRPFTKARLVPQNIPIEVRGNEISVPEVDGYAIVELT